METVPSEWALRAAYRALATMDRGLAEVVRRIEEELGCALKVECECLNTAEAMYDLAQWIERERAASEGAVESREETSMMRRVAYALALADQVENAFVGIEVRRTLTASGADRFDWDRVRALFMFWSALAWVCGREFQEGEKIANHRDHALFLGEMEKIGRKVRSSDPKLFVEVFGDGK